MAENVVVVIDEIQKVPVLLDVVHRLIESNSKLQFALTGSSVRKLKAGGANLLAGRAFLRSLFSLTSLELKEAFVLNESLRFGSLPKIFSLKSSVEKNDFLESYAQVYLKEEVWAEQLVRKIEPFRQFLEIAAQMNGKILNASKMAREVSADVKTIQNYYSILEDTHLGIEVPVFETSARKRLKAASKFYFLDTGIARALGYQLEFVPQRGTSYFGDLFEQFLVAEIYKVNSYFAGKYRFYYLQTAHGVEVDLVLFCPGKATIFIEIKLTEKVTAEDCKTLNHFAPDYPEGLFYCLSNDPEPKRFSSARCMHWEHWLGCFSRSDFGI
jgi:predicted AAA+ superfamily ATPase